MRWQPAPDRLRDSLRRPCPRIHNDDYGCGHVGADCYSAPAKKEGEANMISAAFPYPKRRLRVLGREMAYVEVGAGDPIVLLHGNPTSSYIWRNVLPHLQPRGRCIAPDLIGMGDSDKLPDSGPGSYRFVQHRRYLDALLEGPDVHQLVTFVVHDSGSAL